MAKKNQDQNQKDFQNRRQCPHGENRNQQNQVQNKKQNNQQNQQENNEQF